MICNFILYVRDQEASTRFYQSVLAQEPKLNVPGMTEFQLSDTSVLGLMPEKEIKKLLGAEIGDPEATNGIARAEIYLTVPAPEEFMARAIAAGGRLISKIENRNWGDKAGYVADLDGHILAFASRT